MYVWRICKRKHSHTAFTGEGGLYASGRWHPQGFKIVYTAESLALATLEVFVHIESARLPLAAFRAWLVDDLAVEEASRDHLPNNWQEESAYPALQQIGKDWLQSMRSPILKVLSAIVPVEFNYLLNPQHPDFEVRLESPQEFKFNRRMWKPRIDS